MSSGRSCYSSHGRKCKPNSAGRSGGREPCLVESRVAQDKKIGLNVNPLLDPRPSTSLTAEDRNRQFATLPGLPFFTFGNNSPNPDREAAGWSARRILHPLESVLPW